MAVNTRSVEMQREIDNLQEQLQVSIEGMHCTVTELREQHARSMEEVRQMLVQLTTRGEVNNMQKNRAGGEGETSWQRRSNFQQFSCMQKIDFPQFEIPQFRGEDLKGWLFKCEQFFRINNIPANDKVRLGAANLEGQALQWHRIYVKARLTRELPRWKDYVFALHNRFGVGFDFYCLDNSMDELITLEQSRSVQNYINNFEELSKLVDVNEDVAISCFLRGLSDDIEVRVRMCEPNTLQEAFSLAKSYEQLLKLAIRKQSCIQTQPLLSDFSNPKETSVDRLHIVQLHIEPRARELVGKVHSSSKCSRLTSPTKLNEKQPQGLCCWSHENLGDGNKNTNEHPIALPVDVKDMEEDELYKLVECKVDVKDVEEDEIFKLIGCKVVKEEEIKQEIHPQSWNDAVVGVKDCNCVKAACSTFICEQHMSQETNEKDFHKQEEWQRLLANVNELSAEPSLFADRRIKDYCMILRERHQTYEYHVFKALSAQEIENISKHFMCHGSRKRMVDT